MEEYEEWGEVHSIRELVEMMNNAVKYEYDDGPPYGCCLCGRGTKKFVYIYNDEEFSGDGFPIGPDCLKKVIKSLKSKRNSVPLEEWVDNNCKELSDDIMTHLQVVWPYKKDVSNVETAWRLIMTSIRAERENK